MATSPVSYNTYKSLVDTFRLETPEEIATYFERHKGSIAEFAEKNIRRTIHWIKTGVWVSKESLFSWIRDKPQCKVSDFFIGSHIFRKVIRCEEHLEVPRQPLLSKYAETAKFLAEFIFRSGTVGAILPSSKYLAKEIVSTIPKVSLTAPKRVILEVGPGTGVFTDKIIKRLNPKDELHLVEFDESFCKLLKEKYKNIKNVRVLRKSILDHVSPRRKYDYIVSGLPLNGFSVDTVRKIFEKFKQFSRPGTVLSYFDYVLLPRIKKTYLTDKEREDFEIILAQKESFYKHNKLRSATVIRNIPPARVLHHLMQ